MRSKVAPLTASQGRQTEDKTKESTHSFTSKCLLISDKPWSCRDFPLYDLKPGVLRWLQPVRRTKLDITSSSAVATTAYRMIDGKQVLSAATTIDLVLAHCL
ncbi:hypothetical protein LIA77_09932 [Sarocladium implicatum]|nr:hypothetical protein LIA77_09932 [Sarocladium implicatum]